MIFVKRRDRQPVVDATLYRPDGTAVNLTGATVRFYMTDANGVLTVDAAATIVDAPGGKVRYSWADGDTDRAGDYRAEFEVTFADSTRLTVPNDGYLTVRILEDLK